MERERERKRGIEEENESDIPNRERRLVGLSVGVIDKMRYIPKGTTREIMNYMSHY